MTVTYGGSGAEKEETGAEALHSSLCQKNLRYERRSAVLRKAEAYLNFLRLTDPGSATSSAFGMREETAAAERRQGDLQRLGAARRVRADRVVLGSQP